jgi:beta-galactosidase
MLSKGGRAYLEFRGVNSIAEIKVNGEFCGRHEGGYSTFRVDITHALRDKNQLEVWVDNSPNLTVYPQRADFTFYGGIYRDVYLILTQESHFDLSYYGGTGIAITPKINGDEAMVSVKTFIQGAYDHVSVTIEGVGSLESDNTGKENEVHFRIPQVHLWDGLEDPYLYSAKAELIVNGEVVDTVTTHFGCRTYSFDPNKGFMLNGRPYALHGVSRHQDRKGVGNALTKEMHQEDMELIMSMGANSLRLAHYQHDQFIYDYCDEKGIIVWAEIPYISEHMPQGKANTLSQMRELVVQNYHHPSIICWALSNEISLTGVTEDLLENHRLLNDLVHQLDTTRVTTMANLFLLETDNELIHIPDVMSYNLYYGWYVGEVEENDAFFDRFHQEYPNTIIGLSEYGADAVVKYQSGHPEKGDYTEQYQCLYHEHMLQMLSERPWIWSSYLWNMFEFAADGREEGGDPGVNHKGVVNFDRKTKKDAFYLYQAWWSKEPFVHLCGSRYVDRPEEITQVKVYTNQEAVALYIDGILWKEEQGSHVFCFDVPITGEHILEARIPNTPLADTITIRKTASPNPSYEMQKETVKNWFEDQGLEIIQGYYSIKDTIGEISSTPEGKALVDQMMAQMMAGIGDVAKNVSINDAMMQMINRQSMENMLRQAGASIERSMMQKINKQLNQIKKPTE